MAKAKSKGRRREVSAASGFLAMARLPNQNFGRGLYNGIGAESLCENPAEAERIEKLAEGIRKRTQGGGRNDGRD